jgi:hypothetical protein
MTGVEAHRRLCEQTPNLPLFQQAWWLDAACGKAGWNAVHVERGGEIQAALPFQTVRRRGLTILRQPPLTPFLGPWLRPTGARKARDLGRQKQLTMLLIDALPRHDLFRQCFAPEIDYWLPWHWRGFSQTTRYTYRLQLGDAAPIHEGLRENIRTDIRKASRAGIEVCVSDLESFLPLWRATFERQRREHPPVLEQIQRIDAAAAERGCREILVARDPSGAAHAGAYIVWGGGVSYYLMGGGDPRLRGSGATSLTISDAIRRATAVASTFDFEGSMIEPVERFFRSFGGSPTPFSQVERRSTRRAAFSHHAREALRALWGRDRSGTDQPPSRW